MNNLLGRSQLFIKRNAPTILTCVGAVGVVITAVTAVKATPKAMKLIEKAKEDKGEDLTKLEIVKVAGPAYIPSIVSGAATLACIFGANALNRRQQAALMSAYALLDNSYKEYKKKVGELYGEEADSRVRKEIAKDKYVENGIELEHDDTRLFYDALSERYFESTMGKVIAAQYEVNRRISLFGWTRLNDFYKALDIPQVDYGAHIGWCHGWIDFDHEKMVMDDGLEVIYITMSEEPSIDHLLLKPVRS